ncbi:hypothetical protein BS47DRAFT_1402312 [Hydnum rufescens UP504]|uniref:Uncharacterized protein n=1 Tax=Hydnum rufescens UP504 TaxID=1448309 RepID=A0A9P6AD43_9AGAM|nr:hypothetical protein BS47DRAFT_1402312 [Hydnum rufescens UP504]
MAVPNSANLHPRPVPHHRTDTDLLSNPGQAKNPGDVFGLLKPITKTTSFVGEDHTTLKNHTLGNTGGGNEDEDLWDSLPTSDQPVDEDDSINDDEDEGEVGISAISFGAGDFQTSTDHTVEGHPGNEIQYEIPYGSETCKSAWIGASETWTNFKWRIAEEMDCPITQLKLGYKISTEPVRQAIHFLHNKDEYETMVSDVLVAMDLREKEAKKTKKVTLGKKSAADEIQKTILPLVTGSGLLSCRRGMHVRNIWGRHALSFANGDHYQFTKADISLWGTLLAAGRATLDTPPDALKIMDADRSRPKPIPKESDTKSSRIERKILGLFPSCPHMECPFHMDFHHCRLRCGHLLRIQEILVPRHSHSSPSTTTHTPVNPTHHSQAPSQPSSDFDPTGVIYPSISQWLAELDKNRSGDQVRYSQYAEVLLEHGFESIWDISDTDAVPSATISSLSGMRIGHMISLQRLAALRG